MDHPRGILIDRLICPVCAGIRAENITLRDKATALEQAAQAAQGALAEEQHARAGVEAELEAATARVRALQTECFQLRADVKCGDDSGGRGNAPTENNM